MRLAKTPFGIASDNSQVNRPLLHLKSILSHINADNKTSNPNLDKRTNLLEKVLIMESAYFHPKTIPNKEQ